MAEKSINWSTVAKAIAGILLAILGYLASDVVKKVETLQMSKVDAATFENYKKTCDARQEKQDEQDARILAALAYHDQRKEMLEILYGNWTKK